jgi:hypothetical protein
VNRSLQAAALLTVVSALLLGCSSGSPTAGSGSGSSAAATTAVGPTVSASDDILQQWCDAYATITGVLSEGMTSAKAAKTALLGLNRFAELWKLGANGEIVTNDEANANLRAIAAYRKVLDLVAAGTPSSSPEIAKAQDNVRVVTENDHEVLQSSAGKVLGLCGAPTASPSASTALPSATTTG